MKIIITVMFIISFAACYGQNDFDSLKKYTYPILAIDGATVDGGGSCFFVRRDKKIYLVTAKHILAGCINDSTKKTRFVDKHRVYLGSYSNAIEINTSSSPRILPCDGIDLVICILADTSMSKLIYSVEKYLLPDFTDFEAIAISGFPGSGFNKNRFTHFPGASLIRIQDKDFEILNFPNAKGDYDRYVFGIDWKKPSLDVASIKGYSGAPIFLQNKRTLKWKIAGILTGLKTPGNGSLVFMAVDAVDLLDKLDAAKTLKKHPTDTFFIF